MGPLKTKQLKQDLARARQRGEHKKSLTLLQLLEEAEPRDGSWPHRAAEIHRKLRQPEPEIAALLRAADRFKGGGFTLKAIAVCKRILELDRDHGMAREILAGLSRQPERAPRSAAHSTLPPTPDAESDGSLAELVLTQLIPSAPATTLDAADDGLAEIPLDPPAPPPRAGGLDTAVEQLLPHTELFSSLSPSELGELIDAATIVHAAQGEVIFHEGDPGDHFFVIVEGAVTLVCEGPLRKLIAALAEGEFFGESALLRERPRNATAQAVVDTTLLRIGLPVVRRLIAHSPEVLVVLLSFLRDRLIERLIRTSPLFERLSRLEQEQLTRRFRFLEAAEGSTLIRRGRPAHALFLALSGSLDVVGEKAGEACTFAQLGAGDAFGEMSLVSGNPAMASVVATTQCWLLFLPRQEVEALLSDPRIRVRIESISRDRQRQNAALDASPGLDCSLPLE
jgi:cAMP-dependent protein kinase regulator